MNWKMLVIWKKLFLKYSLGIIIKEEVFLLISFFREEEIRIDGVIIIILKNLLLFDFF